MIGYDLGTIGTIAIGAGTAFAFWALELSNPNPPEALGTAVITGLGGSKILNDMLEKRILTNDRDRLADALGESVEDSP